VKAPNANTVKAVMFVLFVMALVILPFVLFGEDFVLPLLKSREQQAGALTAIAIVMLAADSVAPVPSTIVMMYLAARTGWLIGIVGNTVGLCAGVLCAAWVGRAAVGRLAPKFMPDETLARMRELLQKRLVLTLACLRSVPVLAETSVILAAAAGIPVKRIFWATLLPNFIVAAIYSLAADDSMTTAIVTFAATMLASWVLWRWLSRR
jgi:3-dehydroquinate synthase